MRRVKFRKGQERKFIEKVLVNVNSPSLRELANRMNVSYSTLKNYFSEVRLLPENLFRELSYIAKIDIKKLNVEYLDENWGKIKGGENGRRGRKI